MTALALSRVLITFFIMSLSTVSLDTTNVPTWTGYVSSVLWRLYAGDHVLMVVPALTLAALLVVRLLPLQSQATWPSGGLFLRDMLPPMRRCSFTLWPFILSINA
jgi:hypothetical protein